ncbi:hypothetical protein J4450_02790 [Candidatus Micrarchaeota archaeon]|nr:hypothetical protein [Candidatus Micrarchaeota archaeon]
MIIMAGEVSKANVRESIRIVLQLRQLRPILDAFHARLATVDVGVTLDGSKLVLGGPKKADAELDDILIQSMLLGKLEATFDLDLIDHIRAVSAALEEAKKSLFFDHSFLTQLDSLLKQDVDDPSALARLCLNFNSVVGGDKQLARLGEIADPNLVIAMTRALVSLSVSRPTPVVASVAPPATQEPVAAPESAVGTQMRKVLGLLGIAGAHPVAEEFIRQKLLSGETDLNRIVQLYREAEYEQERQRLAKRNPLTKALVELGIDNKYVSEMDTYYKDKQQAADRLAHFRSEHGDAITVMVVYKQKTRLLEPGAENLAKEFTRRSGEVEKDKNVQDKYKDLIDILRTKIGLEEDQCYVIVHNLKKESCNPERAKSHLVLLCSEVPDSEVRILLLSSPSTLRLLSRVEEAIASYKAVHPETADSTSVAPAGEPVRAAVVSMPVHQPAPTSVDAIALKELLVRIGIDDARANEICVEITSHKGAKKEIERLLQKHDPMHLSFAVYQDPLGVLNRPAHMHKEAERCRDAQKIKDNKSAMDKYAGVYKALRDLGILEAHCYVVIDTLTSKNYDAALALGNLRKLMDQVPASRVKLVLLRVHTVLCNERTLNDAIERYGGTVTVAPIPITNPLTRRLVEIGVDKQFADAFIAKHDARRHAEVLGLVEGYIAKFSAGVVAAVVSKDPNFMRYRDRAEKVLQEHKDKIDAIKVNAAAMDRYKDALAILKRVGLLEEQALLIVATLSDNKANEIFTKNLLELFVSRVPKDKLKAALIERPTVLVKRELAYTLLRKHPKQGEQPLDENPLKELEQRLTALGVDSFTRKEILESDRYKNAADEVVVSLMILEMRSAVAALLAVYKARDMLVSNKGGTSLDGVLKAIDNVKADSARLSKYKDLVKVLTDELGVPLDAAYHILASTHVGKDETLVADLRLLIQRVGKEKVKGVLLKAPHVLSSRHMTEALLSEHPVEGIDEEQLIRDVIAHAATVHSETFEGRDPSKFIRNVVHAAFKAYGGCQADWIWDRVKFFARAIIIQVGPKGVPYDFVVAKIIEGVIDHSEVLEAWESTKPAAATAPASPAGATSAPAAPSAGGVAASVPTSGAVASASPATAAPAASPFSTVRDKLAEYLDGSTLTEVLSAVDGTSDSVVLARLAQVEDLVAGSRIPEAQRKGCITNFLSTPSNVFSLVHDSQGEFDSALIDHVASAES